MRWWGFRVIGDCGNHIDKKIFAVAPHTSAWDFPLGLLIRSSLRMSVQFLGKKSLFKPPFGFLFRWLGGHPVDRSKHNNLVDAIVAIYQKNDQFAIAIAPEGTRQKVSTLRTGFYHIARLAQIPIILIKLDYGQKIIEFSPPIIPSDDQAADLLRIYSFFKGVKGKYPALSFDPEIGDSNSRK